MICNHKNVLVPENVNMKYSKMQFKTLGHK